VTNILIAEDNPVNRELLREMLEIWGYDVSEAGNGREALESIARRRPDVLLLDLDMPVLDGFETIRQIRANPQSATLPVLAVTAYAMQGDREKILANGFDDYTSKPIDFASLGRQIQQLLRTRDCQTAGNPGHAGAAGSGQ